MAFPKNLLNDHEDLILDLRPHWFFMFEPTVSLIGAIILGVVAWRWSPDSDVLNKLTDIPVAVLILVVLCWFGWRYATWATTNFVVTSDRVVWREGVLAKKGTEIPLERINTVFFNQSVFERMIGAGDLGVESAGERGMETFEDVRKPSLVQNEIYRQMEANNQRMYGGSRGAQASAAAPMLSVPEQLEKLDELRRRGVINEEEFAAKKAQLLERM
ncbi:MAG: PH domain-containing protein [Acidimicrobiales bacterium]